MIYIGGIRTFTFVEDGLKFFEIENYHRSATGLFPGTTVYLYPRIIKFKETKDSSSVYDSNSESYGLDIREAVVTPFHPASWAYIWRLKVSSYDRPGILNEVAEILGNEDINIFVQEGLVVNYYENIFGVSLIADFSEYFLKNRIEIKKKLSTDEIEGKKIEIEKLFVRDNESDSKIRVEKFEQLEFLIDNSKDIILPTDSKDDIKNRVERDRLLTFYYAHKNRGTKISSEKKINLKEDIISDLDLRRYAGTNKNYIQGVLFSDSEEKIIITRFFSHKQLVINLKIKHFNRSSATSQFTRIICNEECKYNIIGEYNRIEDDKEIAYWYVLIDVSNESAQVKKLIANLREIPVVKNVEVLSYSESLWNKESSNLELEKSEEQKKKERKDTTIGNQLLTSQRELLKVKNNSLNDLENKRTQIINEVNRKVKNLINRTTYIIVASIVAIIASFFVLKFEILHPIIVLSEMIIPSLLLLYATRKGYELRLPKNDEETREQIYNKLIKDGGHEIKGDNSLDGKITKIRTEIAVIDTNITRVENQLLSGRLETDSIQLKQ